MSNPSTSLDTQDLALRDIYQLIRKCQEVLLTNPSCLHTLAVRGHACMKAKLWGQAVKDFTEILHCRPDDVHGRFSRGMALFKCGKVDDAHSDFSRVLELNPDHVMARYARAGCYNSEGEFNQAIQEYMLALQYDDNENARGFRGDKRRLGLHENAEHLIRKTLGCSRRESSSNKLVISMLESAATCTPLHKQKDLVVRQHMGLIPEKRRRKVMQVRVHLNEWVTATPQTSIQAPQQSVLKADNATINELETPEMLHRQETKPRQESASRVVPKTVRKVTVAL
ncbi:dsRNA-activated protein kinase inhibitor P58, contains TPR and DnaJ domains [Plasmopara halstedii]|uniref:DsRNA-activated protein kinase inhibitor P58, contains TPR and DnaJ domains n=1 Tax=Plasmopara halstedii TaxID=4781 RepID=A0A0P1AB28_PLAHL|nr:dsRNA-activated protein kinase inhibitor P58, contains TPR and DnaJ domains [Plasmopara halstedii]CEG37621.1 dsRNA-activated protein kinase inhibitor P58, contains TPR and DnaJ domains [Plasmopara halstedii]|eukprot:XP_024573990.1 dsRNA-activated protein kinase inhibitor P58, contains TPR and DnaJ domains [Plasmopara halstedii]